MTLSLGNKADFYRNNSMFWILLLSFPCLIYLLSAHIGDLFFSSDWFIDLMALPGFFNAQLSGASYLGRAADHTGKSNAKWWERVGTWLGLGLGVAFGIALSVVHAVAPFAQPLSVVGDFLFTLGTIGAFSGLGNRLGQFVDKGGRPVSEKRAMGIAGIVGIAVGIALFATKCALAVSVMGVTTIMTGGAALPLWIAGAAFVCTFSSTCASSADYVSKAVTFLKADSTNDALIKTTVKEKFHEYRGSLAGVGTGLIVAGVIIGAIAISQPYILAGIVGIIVATMIIASCVSVLGGLFSRVGRMMDAYQFTKKERAKQAIEIEQLRQTHVNDNSFTPSPSHRLLPRPQQESLRTPLLADTDAHVASSPSLGATTVQISREERDNISGAVLVRSPGSGALFAPTSLLSPPPSVNHSVSPLRRVD